MYNKDKPQGTHMKKLFVIILFLFCFAFLPAQEEITRHTMCMNIQRAYDNYDYFVGGIDLEYNYKLLDKGIHGVYLSGGVGIKPLANYFPIGFTYHLGRKNQLLVGMSFMSAIDFDAWNSMTIDLYLMPRLGYYRQIKIYEENAFVQVFLSSYYDLLRKVAIPGFGIGVGIYL